MIKYEKLDLIKGINNVINNIFMNFLPSGFFFLFSFPCILIPIPIHVHTHHPNPLNQCPPYTLSLPPKGSFFPLTNSSFPYSYTSHENHVQHNFDTNVLNYFSALLTAIHRGHQKKSRICLAVATSYIFCFHSLSWHTTSWPDSAK